jgi:uncharacterized protein (DUF433 family)
MQKEYVMRVEDAYRIGNTRVSLDSLVYLFREGLSAESMVECYPSLTLEQVHGALAFYLAGRVLRGLRRVAVEIDFRTASDAGLEGRQDSEVLQIAAESGRILVSPSGLTRR